MKARAWGTALFIFLAIWIVADVLQHLPKNAPLVDRGPEGFPQQVEGIGKVEFAFQGEIHLVAETHQVSDSALTHTEATTLRVPWLSVKGWNPLPKNESMFLSRLAVRSLESAAKKGVRYQLDGPSGLLPLLPNRSTPELDTSRPWLLEKPVIQLPDFLNGAGLTLTLEDAKLHPETGAMQSDGPFVVEGGGLHVVGRGLELLADEKALVLGVSGDLITWSMQTQDSDAIRAKSVFGQLVPQEGIQQLLLQDNVEIVFPPATLNRDSGDTTLMSKTLTLDLVAQNDSWAPAGGRAIGPSTWLGPDGIAKGGDTNLFWDAGQFSGIALAGPTRLEPAEPAGSWATSQSAAVLSKDHTFTLSDNVQGGDAQHTFRADSMSFHDGGRVAKGAVHIQGPDGEMFSDSAHTQQNGGWVFDGNVRGDRQFEGERWQLFTPHAVHGKSGLSDAGPSFELVHGADQLSGEWLKTRHVGDELAITALGDLVLTRDGLVAQGDRLDQKNLKTILSGDPARASFPIQDLSGTARASRMVREDDILFLHGKPRLDLPAQSLGLEGSRVFIDSARANRSPLTGAWSMTGGVVFSGAVSGKAASLHWVPGGEMILKSDFNQIARLAGTRTGQGDFDIQAEVIRIDEVGVGELLRQCVASFQAPDGTPGKVTGHRVVFHESGGRAEGKVAVNWASWAGQAASANWGFTKEGWQLELIDNASLNGAEGSATGHRIFYRHEQQSLRAEGSSGSLAEINVTGGRSAIGDWLEYSIGSRLFSSGHATFQTPVVN
ncbi:MAG: hypothetical protein HN844_01425 [Planctomycetes bacterium]|nr:hypothetical protein [Planctomycetota bacterium]